MDGSASGLDLRCCERGVVVVEHSGRCAGKDRQVTRSNEQRVEHADDPAVDEVEQEGDRLTGLRRIRWIADHDYVDRAERLFVAFHVDRPPVIRGASS
jgi:hypothetical protein